MRLEHDAQRHGVPVNASSSHMRTWVGHVQLVPVHQQALARGQVEIPKGEGTLVDGAVRPEDSLRLACTVRTGRSYHRRPSPSFLALITVNLSRLRKVVSRRRIGPGACRSVDDQHVRLRWTRAIQGQQVPYLEAGAAREEIPLCVCVYQREGGTTLQRKPTEAARSTLDRCNQRAQEAGRSLRRRRREAARSLARQERSAPVHLSLIHI